VAMLCDCLCGNDAIGPRTRGPSHPSREESIAFEVVDYSAIRPDKTLAILHRR
jgi:hypothetical protein